MKNSFQGKPDLVAGEPSLSVIEESIHDFPPEKISPIEPAFFLFEITEVRAYLALKGNRAPGDGSSDAPGLPAIPYVLQALFRQVSDLPPRPDDETAEVAVPVGLHEEVFPGFAAGLTGGFHV